MQTDCASPIPSPTPPKPPPPVASAAQAAAALRHAPPARAPHHRRTQSELAFRIPDDLDFGADPFSSASPAAAGDEIGSEDDLFGAYMDIEGLGGSVGDHCAAAGNGGDGAPAVVKAEEHPPEGLFAGAARPRHRHSSSVDVSSMMSRGEGVFGEIAEAKKAMAADKLAELAAIDPKRAKRSVFAPLLFGISLWCSSFRCSGVWCFSDLCV